MGKGRKNEEDEDEDNIGHLLKKFQKSKRKADFAECTSLANLIAHKYAEQCEYAEALSYHREEKVAAELTNNELDVAVAHRGIGECLMELGRFQEAMQELNVFRKLAQNQGSSVELQRAFTTIGRCQLAHAKSMTSDNSTDEGSVEGPVMDSLQRAKRTFQKSLELAQAAQSSISQEEYDKMQAVSLENLAEVFERMQDLQLALDTYKKVIVISSRCKFNDLLYICESALASLMKRKGCLESALAHTERAYAAAVSWKRFREQLETLCELSNLHAQLGQFSECKRTLRRAYKASRKMGREAPEDVAKTVRRRLASACRLCADYEMLKSEGSGMDTDEKMKLVERLGDQLSKFEAFRQALNYYERQCKLAEELGLPDAELAKIYFSVAETHKDMRQLDQAKECYLREAECRKGEPKELAVTYHKVACLQEKLGESYDSVSETFSKAISSANTTKDRRLMIKYMRDLSALQGRFNLAQKRNETEKLIAKLQESYKHELQGADIDSQDTQSADEAVTCSESSEDIDPAELTESESDLEDVEPVGNLGAKKSSSRRLKGKVHAVAEKVNLVGETALHTAARKGMLGKVRSLLQKQPLLVNKRDHAGWTALHEAANQGHCEVMEVLIAHGANVNDPGGEGCSGTTPLLDAANAGMPEAVRLLLDRGASVQATDPEGRNVSDCLLGVKERSKEWSEEDERVIQDLLLDLATKFGVYAHDVGHTFKAGRPKPCASTSSLKFAGHRLETPEALHKAKKKKRLEGLSSGDVTENVSSSSKAVSLYASAVKAVGRSAVSSTVPSQSLDTDEGSQEAVEPQQAPKEAMVLEQDYMAEQDDWLVDDVLDEATTATSSKRGSCDYMIGNAIRPDSAVRGKPDGRSVSPRAQGRANTDIAAPSSAKKRSSSPQQCTSKHPRTENHADAPLPEGQEILQEFNKFAKNVSITSTQMSPSSEPVSNPAEGLVCGPLPSPPQKSTSSTLRPAPAVSPAYSTENAPPRVETPTPHADFPSREVQSTAFMLKIKVQKDLGGTEEKSFRVHVPDTKRSVGWLADEVGSRYRNSVRTLRNPVIELFSAADGDILCRSDLIGDVLMSGEQLCGRILSWNTPDISARYDLACEQQNLRKYGNVRQRLKTCEDTNVLDLEGYSLRLEHLVPVFRALHGHASLQELRLGGNKLGDDGVDSLIACIAPLPCLQTLDLSSNSLHQNGLCKLLKALDTQDNSRCVTQVAANLLYCNLSSSYFDEHCVQPLTGFLKCATSLQKLSLSNCHLTPQCLCGRRDLWDVTLKSMVGLQHLDLSQNPLRADGLTALLGCLTENCPELETVNLSSIKDTAHNSQPLLAQIREFLIAKQKLVELDLSNCNVNAELSYTLVSAIEQTSSLSRLVLKDNRELNGSHLTAFIRAAIEQSGSRLQHLDFSGIPVDNALFPDLLTALKEKLASPRQLTYLSFSCRSLAEENRDSLRSVWENCWTVLSDCKITERECVLSIHDYAFDDDDSAF